MSVTLKQVAVACVAVVGFYLALALFMELTVVDPTGDRNPTELQQPVDDRVGSSDGAGPRA